MTRGVDMASAHGSRHEPLLAFGIGGALALFSMLALASACSPAPSTNEHPPATQEPSPTPQPAPVEPAVTMAALVEGALPNGPEKDILQSRCTMCHTLDYVTQQRLTEEQWKKTVLKMQTKFGAPVLDEEVPRLGQWLAAAYTTTLPERAPKMGNPPP